MNVYGGSTGKMWEGVGREKKKEREMLRGFQDKNTFDKVCKGPCTENAHRPLQRATPGYVSPLFVLTVTSPVLCIGAYGEMLDLVLLSLG